MNIYKIRLVAAALVVGSLGSLAACGGGGGRPSADEISKVLSSENSLGTVSDKVADCMAKAFHDSDLSDEALQAIVDKDTDYKPSEKDTKALTSVTSKATSECASDAVKELTDGASDLPTEIPSDLASLVPTP